MKKFSYEEVRIENTNRCGYRCSFCPREAMTRPQGTMSVDDLRLVLERVGYHVGEHTGRVDLHGFGEPLLDKDLIKKIKLIREVWPNARPTIYSTLGVHVEESFFAEVICAGLAEVEVSFYGADPDSYRKVHGVNRFALASQNLRRLVSAAAGATGFNLVLRDRPEHQSEQRETDRSKLLQFQDNLAGEYPVKVVSRDLHNYGKGRSYNAPGSGVTCSIVSGFRRRVLQVTWDLKVIPCCFDFDAAIKLGDLRTQSLTAIFESRSYVDFITAHRNDDLSNYPVCAACERCVRP